MRVREFSGLDDLGWIEIPPEIEKMFGDAAEESAVEQSGGLLNNPEANAYVNAIGKKIAALGERQTKDGFDFRFGVVAGQEPNAFALPNGAIYVTEGLLRLLRSD
nr:hypothetical protein [Gemmatimonadales bacterium]